MAKRKIWMGRRRRHSIALCVWRNFAETFKERLLTSVFILLININLIAIIANNGESKCDCLSSQHRKNCPAIARFAAVLTRLVSCQLWTQRCALVRLCQCHLLPVDVEWGCTGNTTIASVDQSYLAVARLFRFHSARPTSARGDYKSDDGRREFALCHSMQHLSSRVSARKVTSSSHPHAYRYVFERIPDGNNYNNCVNNRWTALHLRLSRLRKGIYPIWTIAHSSTFAHRRKAIHLQF